MILGFIYAMYADKISVRGMNLVNISMSMLLRKKETFNARFAIGYFQTFDFLGFIKECIIHNQNYGRVKHVGKDTGNTFATFKMII